MPFLAIYPAPIFCRRRHQPQKASTRHPLDRIIRLIDNGSECNFWTTVNAFDTPSDVRVLQANNWSQPGPTSVRPGWLLLAHALERPECLQSDCSLGFWNSPPASPRLGTLIGRVRNVTTIEFQKLRCCVESGCPLPSESSRATPVTSESQPRPNLALPELFPCWPLVGVGTSSRSRRHPAAGRWMIRCN
jgi:hypothetical protein